MKLLRLLLALFIMITITVERAKGLECYTCDGDGCDEVNDEMLQTCGPNNEPSTTPENPVETTSKGSTETTSLPDTQTPALTSSEVSTETTPLTDTPTPASTTSEGSTETTPLTDTPTPASTTSEGSTETTPLTDTPTPASTTSEASTETTPITDTPTPASNTSGGSTETTLSTDTPTPEPTTPESTPNEAIQARRSFSVAQQLIRNYRSIARGRANDITYACYRVVVTKGDENSKTKRGCVKYSSTNSACEAVRNELGLEENQLKECNACLMDRCNSSVALRIPFTSLLFVTIIKYFV